MNRFDTESIVTRCLTYDDVNAVKAIRGLDLVPPMGLFRGGLRYFFGIHSLLGLSRGLSIETVQNIRPMPL